MSAGNWMLSEIADDDSLSDDEFEEIYHTRRISAELRSDQGCNICSRVLFIAILLDILGRSLIVLLVSSGF